jgi:hypothetical protein
MSHLFPSSRGCSVRPSYTAGGKISDKNLRQQVTIQFCVKIGKSDSEMLALLTLAYGEYTMKKSSVFEWHRRFTSAKKSMQSHSQFKTTFVYFFDHKRLVNYEFLAQGRMMNQQLFGTADKVTKNLVKSIASQGGYFEGGSSR